MHENIQLIAECQNIITVYSSSHLHVSIPLVSMPSQGHTKVKDGHSHPNVVSMSLAKEGEEGSFCKFFLLL